MAGKPSFPRQEWPDGFVFKHDPALPITDEQVREIAASLNVGDDSEHVAAVLAALRRFDGRETAMPELPKGDHRARDIKTLEALAKAMDGLNPNVLAALAHYGVNLSFCDGVHTAACARLAAEDIKRRQPPAKKGARPKTSREVFLQELAEIYADATGIDGKMSVTSESKKTAGGQPTGRFFTFMRAAVAPLPDLKRPDDHALAKATTRATRTKRR